MRLAKELILKDNPEELVFVFNTDIICEFHLEKLIAAHKAKGGEGTIYLTKVTEPSKYGVVVTDENDKILVKLGIKFIAICGKTEGIYY